MAKSEGRRAKSMAQRDNRRTKFRFEDLEIWQLSVEIAEILFNIADELEEKKLFRFAEQLRGAGISMSNNIAEGSGSLSKKEFIQFLNFARRSTFENANMTIIFTRRGLIAQQRSDDVLQKLDMLCRKITSFQRSLK